MAPETILSVLTRPNPAPILWRVYPGPNTIGRDWVDFERCDEWPAFNAKNLRAIYKDIVEAPWPDAPNPISLSRLDRTFSHEKGLETQILGRANVSYVNDALRHARKLCRRLLPDASLLHLGEAGRCGYGEDNRITPDWVLVEDGNFEPDGRFMPIMAGDTKLSAKWQPDLFLTNDEQWRRPLQQVLTYACSVNCRYTMILLDSGVVCLEVAREKVDPGIGAIRGRRPAQAVHTHQRVFSDASELSGSLQGMSIDSSGSGAYVDTESGLEIRNPKLAFIPWRNEGISELTVNLSLFYICMMAGYGSSHLSSGYPKLNTWWRTYDGTYRHNTSGFIKTRLGSKDKEENPEGGSIQEQGMQSEEYDLVGQPGSVMEDDTNQEDEEHAYLEDAYPELSHTETFDPTEPQEGYDNSIYGFDQGEDSFGDGKIGEDLQNDNERKGEEVGPGRQERPSDERKKPERAYPKLRRSEKPVVEVSFSTHKGTWYFKSRDGSRIPVRKNQWSMVEYEGRVVHVYKGNMTNYIANALP